jgi:signal transduction histidine kinase
VRDMLRSSRRPTRNEVLLAAAVGVLAIVEPTVNDKLTPHWASISAGLVAAGALAWRRVYPFAALVVICTAWCVEIVAGVPIQEPFAPFFAIIIATYTLTAYAPLERLFAGLAVLAVADAVAVTSQHQGLDNFAFGAVWAGAAVLVGWLVRVRVEETKRLQHRAELLEQEREEQARLAVEAERSRIARELHDVIAHSLGVMVVQAGAAEEVLRHDPERALQPVRAIQETGRRALDEMGLLLGVLREPGEEIGLAPQPGLGELEALIAETRAAGLPVELTVDGLDESLPAGIELSIYRIVQEALTNTRKHGGDARARVNIGRRDDQLVIEVVDDGDGRANGAGSGLGLVGMRERVSVFGGSLEAEPQPSGGFRIRASLPLGEQS